MTSRDRTATWRPRGRGRRNGTGPRALHARNILYVPGRTGNRWRQNDGGTSVSEIRTPEASSNYDADADVEAEANPNASATPAVNEPDNHYQVQTQPSEASTSSTAVATSWTGSTTDDEGLQPNHVQASSATPLADVVPEQIVSTNNGVSLPGSDGRSADTALIELSPEVSRSHGSQHH
ncbi:uncharacterized protein BJX67DRAFT_361392 [Aspergillus lucknowensis]|uniref:Uncharacterized protein n=1 Tax=Aspergillus lucknowensis TaxID=176173 RepID=A0ABR4LIE5_9EURO